MAHWPRRTTPAHAKSPSIVSERAQIWYDEPMRRSFLPFLAVTLAGAFTAMSLGSLSSGCDSPKSSAGPAVTTAATTSAIAPPSASSVQVAATDASVAAKAADGGAHVMPERPVPRESPTVRANMSPEIQMKAITYMAAMRAPGPDDPPADEAYAEEVRKKLDGIVLGADHGGKHRPSEVVGGGRQIDLFMNAGCDDKTGARVVSQGGYTLSTLRTRGIFVVRCNGSQVQCLQSTRDPGDVLCTTAPRH